MPLFLVHLRSPTRYERDDIGVEHATLEAAYLDVCDAVPAIAAALMREGRNPLEHTFEIADADGTTLLEVPFTERLREGGTVRRPPEVRQLLTQAERAEALVESVRKQVEALHQNMRGSRLWLEQLRRNRQN